jgi:hypothetical protein
MRESRTYGSGRGACDETRVPTATQPRVHHAAQRVATAWPFAAPAQEPGRTYRLGFLIPSPRNTPAAEAQFDELRLNGFIKGQNLVVIPGFDVPNDAVAERAAALVKATPDAIITGPDIPIRTLQAATRTVPIVGMTEDMVGGTGVIAGAARRQRHRNQFALARARRQATGHFDCGSAARASNRGRSGFRCDSAVPP